MGIHDPLRMIRDLLREIGEEPISGVWLGARLRDIVDDLRSHEREAKRIRARYELAEARAIAAEREVDKLRTALVDLRDAHERTRRGVYR